MREILPLILGAVGLCAAVTGQAQVERELYDSRKLCRVFVPLSWTVNQQPMKFPEGVSAGGASHADKSLILVSAYDRSIFDQEVSAEEILKGKVDQLEAGSEKMVRGEVKEGQIDGKPTKYQTATVKTSKAELALYWVVIEAKDRYFLIQASCHQKNRPSREPEFLKSIGSFREIKS